MTDRPLDGPPAPDDRTRDITLPPLPDRPPPALPAEWAGHRTAVDPPTTVVPGLTRPPVAPTGTPPAEDPAVEEPDPAEVEARLLAGRRTDELAAPAAAAVRQRTLAFTSPEMRHRPIEPVQVGAKPRRWPWVVLTLLPILVIVASTVAWLILLRGS
ncbi:hypothetical protein [Blastococcus goldschmidtiae]|uniref:Uncharacterized protein n=1 Tax=Blastococcus goldschmidtiae TaxID=3075546 RepID=A0ABU2K764_9ACTN|nr:hypothetical protein [Blastococcus sp. DSM 46792]MDT0276017.1 hypothetical protein [Blastococcus sp. DSM 46792]